MPTPPRSILPPANRRIPWLAIAVSLGFHSLLLLVKVGSWLPPRVPRERLAYIPLGAEGTRAVEMAYREPSDGGARRRPPNAGVSDLPNPETSPEPERPSEPEAPPVVAERPLPDTSSGPIADGARTRWGRIGPAQGEGKLWVRPLPLPPRDLARVVARSQAELVDSAVTAIVQAYLDSVLTVAAATDPVPRWVTKVGDQQLGIDAQWIYLGPIKVPTALVAGILSAFGALPAGGSAETSDYPKFRALQQMREDTQIAARRAATMADFKRAIHELRAERERIREFVKNQRTPPPKKADSTGTKTP